MTTAALIVADAFNPGYAAWYSFALTVLFDVALAGIRGAVRGEIRLKHYNVFGND